MRITNKMMTNNMLHNINTNKTNMTNLENKYASGMEIQKPSDDPIVAVRAMKLRTNLSELNQYYQKNIPDAMSWMETTENALQNTSEIITNIHTYCVQGANDPLTEKERSAIVDNLTELKKQAYQEGNSNYAGRYLFTGYKTDTPLLFQEKETGYNYSITEKIKFSEVEISSRIIDSLDVGSFDISNPDAYTIDYDNAPEANSIYRIRLAYKDLRSISDGGSISIAVNTLDANGNVQSSTTIPASAANMKVMTSDQAKAYAPEDDDVIFLNDTGEIILGKNVYNSCRDKEFQITYDKNTFEKDELRPEHYFDCIKTDNQTGEITNYVSQDQDIEYEVNFNQRLAINVQGKDAFRHSLGRSIDDMVNAISDVNAVNEKIAMVDKWLEEAKLETNEDLQNKQTKKLNEMKTVLERELALKDSIIRETFGKGLTAMSNEENTVNAAQSDLGTRYSRLELTQDRLSTQQVEFTELLSQNEDADLVDTIVNYNAANTVYNASLQAAGKVVKNSLLDFL